MSNGADEFIRAMQDNHLYELSRHSPIGGGGPIKEPVGIGNLAGWAMAAGMIGALLGAIVGAISGQGIVGAIIGGLLFAGIMAALTYGARFIGMANKEGGVLKWGFYGAVFGAAIGALLTLGDIPKMPVAVFNCAIFFGLIALVLRVIARFAARNVVE